jgi:hypothetical protein
LRLFGLEAEVLAQSRRGDGRHLVLKVERAGAPFVLKLYGRKRDWLRDFLRDLGQRFVVGKSGMKPERRRATERASLELWRSHGFDVPRVLDDVALPSEVPPLRLVLEWVPGRPMNDVLADVGVGVEAKRRLLAGCAAEWTRRHEKAIALREPRLLHAHAYFGHVLVSGGRGGSAGEMPRLVSLDFEVAWTRGDVERLVARELAGFLRSLSKRAPAAELPALRDALVDGYAPRDRIAGVVDRAPRGGAGRCG